MVLATKKSSLAAAIGVFSANRALLLWGAATVSVWTLTFSLREFVGRPLGRVVTGAVALHDERPPIYALFAFVPLFLAYRQVTRATRGGDRAIVMLVGALSAIALAVSTAPMGSHDVYLYIFQGRALSFHGLNPYAVLPSSVDDPFVGYMGPWLAGLKNTYGPLWTAFAAYLTAFIDVGETPRALVVAFKSVTAAFMLACAPLAAAIMREIRPDVKREVVTGVMLLIAWNPALLFESARNGHNDAVMLCFLLLAVLYALKGRAGAAGAAFAASFLTKYITVLCLPFFVAYFVTRMPRGGRTRAVAAFVGASAALAVAAYAPFWIGPSTFDGLLSQSGLSGLNVLAPVPFIVILAATRKLPTPMSDQMMFFIRGVSYFAFLSFAAMSIWTAFRRGVDKAGLGRYCLLMLASYLFIACFWLMPWYLTWIVPLLAIAGMPVAAVIATVAVFLLYLFNAAYVLIAALAAFALHAFVSAAHSGRRAA